MFIFELKDMLEREIMSFLSGFSGIFIAPIISEIIRNRSFEYYEKGVETKLIHAARDAQIAIFLSLFAPLIIIFTHGDLLSIIENLTSIFLQFIGAVIGFMARAFYRVFRLSRGPYRFYVTFQSVLMMFLITFIVISLALIFTSWITVIIGIVIGLIAGVIGLNIKDIISGLGNLLFD